MITNEPDSSDTGTDVSEMFSAGYLDDGRRAWSTAPDGTLTYYFYDDSGAYGNVPLGEYNAQGVEQALNVVGPDGWRERVLPGWAQDQDGYFAPYTGHFSDDYFCFDPQGATAERVRIDDSQNSNPVGQNGDLPYLYDEAAYDAWGNRLFDYDPWGTSSSLPGPEQTTPEDVAGYEAQYGYQTDTATGLVLAGHRFYQPGTGRWLNRDPIGYAGGGNLYRYADNDPVNEADPSGDDPGTYSIGPSSNPWFVFTLGDTEHGLKVGLAATASALTWDRYDGGQYKSDPYFQDSHTLATVGREAGVTVIGGKAVEVGAKVFEGLRGARAAKGLEDAEELANCFVAGTPVQMADGTTKPIEEVRAGDLVESRDPGTGENESEPVVATDTHLTPQTMTLSLSDGEMLECTPEHRFFVEGQGFVDAGKLKCGDVLEYADEEQDDTGLEPLTLTVSGVQLHLEATSLATATRVYNFTVASTHTYFVGTTHHGIWVHNVGPSSSMTPALSGTPYSPEAVEARIKLPYEINPKHLPGGVGSRLSADAEAVYAHAEQIEPGTWVAKGKEGWYQYFSNGAGKAHWAGTRPLNRVPIDLQRGRW